MPVFPLRPRSVVDRTALGDEFHQAGRLVGVELIADEDPLGLRIGVHGGGDVGDEVRFGAGVADGGGDDAPGGDLEVGDQRLGAVTFILEFDRLGMARAHRLGRVNRLQGLHPGFLIRGDDMHPLLMQLRRLMVELADRAHLLAEGGLVRRSWD